MIEFPLGFCPAGDAKNFVDFNCQGQWGLVLKEWETITATYPQVHIQTKLIADMGNVAILRSMSLIFRA